MVTTLNTALRFELLGQEVLVHDPVGGLVVRLSGAEHSVIVRLTNGEQIVDPTESEEAAIDRLIEAGIVLKDDSTSMFSRRRVMQLSAAGVAAAGLSYLVLPGAAAAASISPSTTAPATTTTTIAPPTPSAGLVSAASDSAGNVSVRWALGASTPFNYSWVIRNQADTTDLAVSTVDVAANGFVATGYTIPTANTAVIVRLTAGAVTGTTGAYRPPAAPN